MGRPLSEEAREQMLLAAREILAERGVEGFTVDEVRRRSGVAKSTIYRHFDSVDELMLAALDQIVQHVDATDTGSFETDLRTVIGAFLEISGDDRFRTVFLSVLARARVDAEFADRLKVVKEHRHSPLRLVIQRGMARGEVDPEIDIELAMNFVQGPFMTMLVEDDEVRRRDVDVYLDLIRRGLAPRG